MQSPGAGAGTMLLVVLGREWILLRLDAWFYPEIIDQREALAHAATVLAKVTRITTASRTVSRTAKWGCGSPVTLLLGTDTEAEARDFSAPDAKLPPLGRGSTIAHILETASGSLRVHPHDKTSSFAMLPPADAAWVIETDADVILPVPGPGGAMLGLLVVGRRFNGRIVRCVDIPFLEALGGAAGLTVARLRLMRTPGARSLDALPAYECPVCWSVTETGEPPACDCGAA